MRRLVQAGSRGRIQSGRGGFLDHFLVSTLCRAIALAENDHASVTQTENLNLDMAGHADIFFNIDAALFEIRLT